MINRADPLTVSVDVRLCLYFCVSPPVCVRESTGRAAVDRHQYECLIYALLLHTTKAIFRRTLRCLNITHTCTCKLKFYTILISESKKASGKCTYCKNWKSCKFHVGGFFYYYLCHYFAVPSIPECLWHSRIIQY